MAVAEIIALENDTFDTTKPLDLFDPVDTWKTMTLDEYSLRELHVPIFKNGVCVYKSPSIDEIRAYCQYEVDHLWEEVKRFENPHKFYVDLSQKLYDTKMRLLDEKGSNLMQGKEV